APSTATVIGERVALHAEPGGNTPIATLHAGDTVQILARTGEWYRIRTGDGESGYVAAFTLVPGEVDVPSRARTQPSVLAYYVDQRSSASFDSLEQHLSVIDTLSPWAWQITPEGGLKPDFQAGSLAEVLRRVGEAGVESLALVHNHRRTAAGTDGFDASLIHAVLTDPSARARAISAIVAAVQRWGMSGVHIDFEDVPPADRNILTSFVAALSEKMRPLGLAVTMAVPAKTRDDRTSRWSGAFDYAALAPHLDALMLMTYDEHHPGGPPGPVASVGWVEEVVRYALAQGVPPSKIYLGLPAYGYDWAPDGTATALTYHDARRLSMRHQVKIEWDETAEVPFFRYQGHEVWFEDRYSASHKLALVKEYGLGGVSVWRLGQEDPGLWTAIDELLG
ncbi:MAG TPA: glycosyl hydrolase family 18 protein, partial [Limnochordia bacterium]